MPDLKTILMTWTLTLIKIVGSLHFLLPGFALCTAGMTHPVFSYSNEIFLIALIWVIVSNHSKDACEAALFIDACSFVLDIIGLIQIYSNDSYEYSVTSVTKTFLIINLIIRPLSMVLLFVEWRHRKGSVAVNTAVSGTSRTQTRTTTVQVQP